MTSSLRWWNLLDRILPGILWILPLGFLAVFFVNPLYRIVSMTMIGDHGWRSLPADLPALILDPLIFSTGQALLSTAFTAIIGIPAAYLFGRFTFTGKRFLRTMVTLPFILPTVVTAAAFNAMIGPRGWMNLILMRLFDLDSAPIRLMGTFWIVIFAHIFYNLSIMIRMGANAWEKLDLRYEQAARSLGASPWMVLRTVTLPMLRPTLTAAAVMVFLFNFTSFGVILLLGSPGMSTLETAIYTQAMFRLDLPAAGLLAGIQLLFTLAIGLTYQRLSAGSPSVPAEIPIPRRMRSLREKMIGYGLLGLLILITVLPLLSLGARSVLKLEAARGERGAPRTGLTVDYYVELWTNRRQDYFYVPPLEAARNSLLLASTAAFAAVTLGTITAYTLCSRSRWTRILDVAFLLPFGASSVTMGYGFILAFNTAGSILAGSPILIPLAHTLIALPFAVRSLTPAVAAIAGRYRDSGRMLGANPLAILWTIDLPLLAKPMLSTAIFAFTISLGEFGAAAMLARADMPTLPIAIFRYLSQPGSLNYGQALAMSTLLLILCAGAVLLIERLDQPAPLVMR